MSHKIEKVGGRWSFKSEHRVELISEHGDILDHVWITNDIVEAVESARAWSQNISEAAESGAPYSVEGDRVAAVIVERCIYTVPTRAEARALAAREQDEPSDLEIEQVTVWHMGEYEALREWVRDCVCIGCYSLRAYRF